MKLTDFKALTFDRYGTLIDWESGTVEGLLATNLACPTCTAWEKSDV